MAQRVNAVAPISITGGTYSVNGGAYTSSSGTVSNGNTVTVRVTSSGSYSTTVNATLTIGGVSDTFSVTTQSAPTSSGILQFTSSSYNINENGGSVVITVIRTGGSNGTVGVNYGTSNGTAIAGSDYTVTSGTLSWANGETSSKTFSVPILDDSAYEGNETVNLTLNNPTGGATLGSPSTAVLTIIDTTYHLTIQNLVTRYYQNSLDRAPDTGGLDWWTLEIERIVSMGIDIRGGFQALAKFFFNCAEYGQKNKSNVEFVTDLYQTFLGRDPDPGGLDFWVNYLKNGLTRNMLITQFAYSAEFKNYVEGLFGIGATRPEDNLANDLYRSFLNRFPDPGGFNTWVSLMRNAQCTGDQAVRDVTYQIASAFMNSAEYGLRGRDNWGYVEDLYSGILMRGADPGGYLHWVGSLNNGTYTREQVLKFFTDSAEFQFRVDAVINAGCLN